MPNIQNLTNIFDKYSQNPNQDTILEELLKLANVEMKDENKEIVLQEILNIIAKMPDQKKRKILAKLWMESMVKMEEKRQKLLMSQIARKMHELDKLQKTIMIQMVCDLVADNYQKISKETQNVFKQNAGEFFANKQNVMDAKEQEREIKITRMPSGTSLKMAIDFMKSSMQSQNQTSKDVINQGVKSMCENLFSKEIANVAFGVAPVQVTKK